MYKNEFLFAKSFLKRSETLFFWSILSKVFSSFFVTSLSKPFFYKDFQLKFLSTPRLLIPYTSFYFFFFFSKQAILAINTSSLLSPFIHQCNTSYSRAYIFNNSHCKSCSNCTAVSIFARCSGFTIRR